MADENSWQSQISFTDRHFNLQRIQNALQRGHPQLSLKDASIQASTGERQAFDSSSTREEYGAACHALATLPADDLDDSNQEVDHVADDLSDATLSPAAEAIGRFTRAHHWRDGLFSTVFRAVDPQHVGDVTTASDVSKFPVVALKVTTPSMMVAPHDSEREARILRESSSPHVVPLLEFFQMHGGRFVLVFPFLQIDLEHALHSQKLSAAQVKRHLKDMFSGLKYLHAKGIVHRDVKPSNILLRSASGPAFLADFGIAWSPNDDASEPADDKITDVGTTCYRPPELLFGNRRYDCSLDLWAAGCVVAEAASLWQHRTLFDSGDLGSELALIQSIFRSLGTPNLTTWPEAETFPDWGKMEFKRFPAKTWDELLPEIPPEARDLVNRLVRFESGDRLSARECLEHSYFAG